MRFDHENSVLMATDLYPSRMHTGDECTRLLVINIDIPITTCYRQLFPVSSIVTSHQIVFVIYMFLDVVHDLVGGEMPVLDEAVGVNTGKHRGGL